MQGIMVSLWGFQVEIYQDNMGETRDRAGLGGKQGRKEVIQLISVLAYHAHLPHSLDNNPNGWHD